MTDTSHLVAEANAISNGSANIKKFCQDAAANLVQQEGWAKTAQQQIAALQSEVTLQANEITALQVAVAALQNPTPPPSTNGSVSGRWFTSTAWPNTPVGANPSVDPGSPGWMATLIAANQNGIYPNTNAWSVPVYHATAATPTATVRLTIPYLGSATVTIP